MLVAASRDVPVVVDLARLVAPRREKAPTAREFPKFAGFSIIVVYDSAVTAPIPGTVINNRHAGLWRAAATSCRSSAVA